MANELREYEIELRKEGETKARKKIARKMKKKKSYHCPEESGFTMRRLMQEI